MEENPTIKIEVIVADFSKGKEIFEELAKQLKDIPIGILGNWDILIIYVLFMNLNLCIIYLWMFLNLAFYATWYLFVGSR